MSGEARKAWAWLDADGLHIWLRHICDGEQYDTMLPYPAFRQATWDTSSPYRVDPSVNCLRCGFHEFVYLDNEGERIAREVEARPAVGLNPETAGLPPDLADALKDPTITVSRDHETRLPDGRTLFEHLEEWRNAPSNTATGDRFAIGEDEA